MRALQLTAIGMLVCMSHLIPNVTSASLIVDFSPDTTGATLGESSWTNVYGSQIVGDQFTLSADTILTGGSIFSNSDFGNVGDDARFMVFAGSAPTSAPIIDILTKIDVIDGQYTSGQSSLTRKHATITPTFLAAGTYWFALAGDPNDLTQASTTTSAGYDDGAFRFGSTTLQHSAPSGDMYFQLEGTSAIPEPSTYITLSGLILCFGLAGWWRKPQQAG